MALAYTSDARAYSKALQELSNSSILDTGAFGRTGRFSAEGQLVIEDIRAFIDSLVTVGDEKNGDDKFQRFLYHSSQMQVEVETPDIKTSVSQREINKDSKKAAESLRTLGNVLITSPEFRNIISDATFLGEPECAFLFLPELMCFESPRLVR